MNRIYILFLIFFSCQIFAADNSLRQRTIPLFQEGPDGKIQFSDTSFDQTISNTEQPENPILLPEPIDTDIATARYVCCATALTCCIGCLTGLDLG